jgi:hypothetical protein
MSLHAMPFNLRVSAVITLVTLGACTGQPVQKAAPTPVDTAQAASNAEQISALYARLDDDEKRFAAARIGSDRGADKSAAEAKAARRYAGAASAQCLAFATAKPSASSPRSITCCARTAACSARMPAIRT